VELPRACRGEVRSALALSLSLKIHMSEIRLTQNAVAGFHRVLCPSNSMSGAYRELRQACRQAHYTDRPPSWLRRARADNDGYLLLNGELAALPIRHGRAVACLANPGDRPICSAR
jgi:hypothetical protein